MMALHNIKWALLLFVLFSACLNGCARRQPTSLDQLSMYRKPVTPKDIKSDAANAPPTAQKTSRSFTPFEEIVVSLVFDSLDLFPDNIRSDIYGVILDGIEIPGQDDAIDKSILSSGRKEDIALLAGQIVHLVYGENFGKEAVIPQAVLFIRRHRKTYADITALGSSENRTLDAYNSCLSLLVSLLSDNYGIQLKSRDGLYLRDSKNNLYFHKDVKFLGHPSN